MFLNLTLMLPPIGKKIKTAAEKAGLKAKLEGIYANRPNEAGPRIESYVLNALIDSGLKADTPKTSKGIKKSSGYLDIQITDNFNNTIYLECKTYYKNSKAKSLRTFNFSPSQNFKITNKCVSYSFKF